MAFILYVLGVLLVVGGVVTVISGWNALVDTVNTPIGSIEAVGGMISAVQSGLAGLGIMIVIAGVGLIGLARVLQVVSGTRSDLQEVKMSSRPVYQPAPRPPA